MREIYVYYRVKSTDADALVRAVRDLREDLESRLPGVRTRLLRRADGEVVGELATDTWMEIHDCPDRGIDPSAQAWIETLAAQHLAGLIAGPRHVEVFVGMD